MNMDMDSAFRVFVRVAETESFSLTARQLGIEVILLRRPQLPDVPSAPSVAALAEMVDHFAAPAEKRGV